MVDYTREEDNHRSERLKPRDIFLKALGSCEGAAAEEWCVLIPLDLAGGLMLFKDRLDAGGQASVREARLNGPDLRAASCKPGRWGATVGANESLMPEMTHHPERRETVNG